MVGHDSGVVQLRAERFDPFLDSTPYLLLREDLFHAPHLTRLQTNLDSMRMGS